MVRTMFFNHPTDSFHTSQEPVDAYPSLFRNFYEYLVSRDAARLVPADIVLFLDSEGPGEFGLS